MSNNEQLFSKKYIRFLYKERNYSKVLKNFKSLNGLKLFTLQDLRKRISKREGVDITPRSLAYSLSNRCNRTVKGWRDPDTKVCYGAVSQSRQKAEKEFNSKWKKGDSYALEEYAHCPIGTINMSFIEDSLYKMDWGYDDKTKKLIQEAVHENEIGKARCLYSMFENGYKLDIEGDSAKTSPASWSSFGSSVSVSSEKKLEMNPSNYEILFAYDTSKKNYGMLNKKGKPIYYSKSEYSRIHGFIIIKTGGCIKDAVYKEVQKNNKKVKEEPDITQLVLICSSHNSIYKGIGSLLIATYLFISQYLRFDISILEVANDMDDDGLVYGDKLFKKGKKQKKNLYCFYEKVGYREEPLIHKPWGCFDDDLPLPTMYLDLKKYSRSCLANSFLNRTWTEKASSFCKTDRVKVEPLCSRKRQKPIKLVANKKFLDTPVSSSAGKKSKSRSRSKRSSSSLSSQSHSRSRRRSRHHS